MREQRREVGCSWVRGGGGGAGGPRAQGGGSDSGCVCGGEMGGQRTEAARRAPGPGPPSRPALGTRPWDLCWGGGKCQRATAVYAQCRAEVRDTCYANAHQGSGRPIETCAEDPTLAYRAYGVGSAQEWQGGVAFARRACVRARRDRACARARAGRGVRDSKRTPSSRGLLERVTAFEDGWWGEIGGRPRLL